MRSTRIDFTGDRPKFDFGHAVAGFLGTVQNALVNLGTDQGSDRLYPNRGTRLRQDAISGRMISQRLANHSANFAALRTLTFIQETGDPDVGSQLQSLTLQARIKEGFRVELLTKATSANGKTIGELATV